jgi:hypothetical protein
MSLAHLKTSYLPILSAQVQCINEQLIGIKQERLSLVQNESDYRIEKTHPGHCNLLLFQGKGRDCHVFLNGYQSFFFTE